MEYTMTITSNRKRYPVKHLTLVKRIQNRCMDIYEYLLDANRMKLDTSKSEEVIYIKDLVNEIFHDLKVISFAGKRNRTRYWLCECKCGNRKEIREDHLTSGVTHSCGCKKKSQIIQRNKENTKHGKRYTRVYKIWQAMKYRCYNPNSDEYQYYGERGICLCDEWNNNFSKFYNWVINNGYKDNLTIDRIDVNGNYEPDNCRWTTMKIQENNKRNNNVLAFNGKEQTVTQWGEELGMNRDTIYKRLKSGWSVEDALSKPVNNRKVIKV